MKHAFLIIAHKDDYTFRTLINLLDDERNDIFIHMDIKNREFDFKTTEKLVTKSRVFQVKERNDVVWGDYSQIATELKLLALATSVGEYAFYHLMSGEDLPIKTQDYFHAFFERNSGKEFVRFENPVFAHQERVYQYHFLQRIIGRPESHPILYSLEWRFIQLQKLLGIKRNRHLAFQKGANWFSITDGLARLVVAQSDWIRKTFRYTECCDEVFLQTIVNQSEYKTKLYHQVYDNDPHAIMRLIDWNRGTPYIFRQCDRDELSESDMLFARKFDCSVDREIIDYVAQDLCGRR